MVSDGEAVPNKVYSHCFLKRLWHPPTDSMKRRSIDYQYYTNIELPKHGITFDDVDETSPPWDPIDISPEWFSLGYVTDCYCSMWIRKTDYEYSRDRVLNEFKSFLSAIIAQLKSDMDIAN